MDNREIARRVAGILGRGGANIKDVRLICEIVQKCFSARSNYERVIQNIDLAREVSICLEPYIPKHMDRAKTFMIQGIFDAVEDFMVFPQYQPGEGEDP